VTTLIPPKLATLLARLRERGPVRRANGEWRTTCPAHDDRGPSLYVALAPSGERLLVHCNAGCDVEDVMADLDMDLGDLYLDDDSTVAVGDDFEAVDGEPPAGPGPEPADPGLPGQPGDGVPLPPADTERCHEVYTALLALLTLSDRHRGDLRRRGLGDGDIDRLGYRGLEKFAVNQAVGQLKGRFDEDQLLRVPGFLRRKGKVRFSDAEGLVVPVRDLDGRVIALKVRLDAADGGPKYVWASGGAGGASCGSPPHVPLGTPARATTVRLTEGELKADVAFVLSGLPTLGAPGVAGWRACLPLLEAMGAAVVLVAFDADARTKPGVARDLAACLAGLARAGFEARAEVWDPADGKGVDDLLAVGKHAEVVAADKALAKSAGAAAAGPAGDGGDVRPLPHPDDVVAPFPVDVLPDPVARFVTEEARAIQCPADFLGVATLVVAAAAVGGSRRLRIRPGYEEGPRIYAAIVAPPGSAKSPALRAACGPVYARQKMLRELYREAKGQYEEDVAGYDAARRKGDDPPEKPVKPAMDHAFVSDVTTERLAAILEESPRGVLQVRDELTAWVLAMDQYRGGKGADRPFYLSAWSGEPVKVDRKQNQGEPLVVTDPYLSVLGCIPPARLGALDAGNDGEDGFVHRLLFAFPDPPTRRCWSWEGVGHESTQAWHGVVARLYELPMGRDEFDRPTALVVDLAADARPVWQDWYDGHAREAEAAGFPEVLVGPWSKLVAYAARLALVVHLLRQACGEAVGDDVDAESLGRAVRLVDYFQSHARAVYARLRRSRTTSRVVRAVAWIRGRGGEVRTSHLTKNEVAGVEDKRDAEALLKELEDRGYGRCDTRTAGNRAKVLWFVLHPDGSGTGRDRSGGLPDR
jgi:hypothetical protein